MTTLSIIVLNWNTADLLADCLTSIQNHVTMPHEVIVVDNNSSDNSVTMVQEQFPQYKLLVQTENIGFSRGNNVGLTQANGRYLLLLNPDTQIRPGGLKSLIAFMEENPEVGIAGPTLWNPDGSHQPSTAPFPTLWLEFLRQTMLYRPFPTAEQRAARTNTLRPVDSVTGAALCIRRHCYEQIGPLDPDIFMFYEDTDWCKRARDAGWQVWFVPGPGIMHVKAAASSRFARTRTLLDSQRSTIYYFTKHYGRRSILVLRWITLCGAKTRSLRAIFLWLLNRNRPDQQARLKAYGRMWWWALTARGL